MTSIRIEKKHDPSHLPDSVISIRYVEHMPHAR